MRRRLVGALFVYALTVSGCGLLLGIEDRELPASEEEDGSAEAVDGTADVVNDRAPDVSTDGSPNDGATADADAADADAADADAGDGGADACTCAAGCNPDGACNDELVSIAMGNLHSCVVRGDGKLFCMGSDRFGQLGSASAPASSCVGYPCAETFVPVGVGIAWKEVGANNRTSCALSRGGDLYCWGENDQLQLGPDAGVIETPRKIELGAKVTGFAVGRHVTCAIVETAVPTDPNVRCWGYRKNGELGTGVDPALSPDDATSTPQTVKGLRAKSLQANDNEYEPQRARVCAIDETDVAMCWGSAADQAMQPYPANQGCPIPNEGSFYCTLEPVPLDGYKRALSVGAGHYEVCAIFAQDAGANTLRCRGIGTFIRPDTCAVPSGLFDVSMPPDSGVSPVTLTRGALHACFIDTKNEVYCLGLNNLSQLGSPGSDSCGQRPPGVSWRSAVPVRVDMSGSAVKARLISAGAGALLVYTQSRELLGFGYARAGGLGASTPYDASAEGPSCNTPGAGCVARVLPLPPAN